MKKNLIIGILAIVSVVSLSFGLYQKDRADRNELKAIENERIAREMADRAQEQMKLAREQTEIARQNAVEAMRQRQIAVEERARK